MLERQWAVFAQVVSHRTIGKVIWKLLLDGAVMTVESAVSLTLVNTVSATMALVLQALEVINSAKQSLQTSS